MNVILDIQELSKTYKSDLGKPPFQAVKGLNLSCKQGICTGLLGHNGAGKTTTIKTILGLIHPDAGKVYFDGKPMSLESRAHIGYMPESNRMPLNLSCYEILKMHLTIVTNETSANAKERIEESLREVGLWDHRHKFTKQLSKGMGRRLAWAQATIHKPKFLILDEPFSGLDPKGRRDMRQWIENYKKSGTSILLCAHELPAVASLCEKIAILKQGKLVYESPEQQNLESGVFELSLAGTDLKMLETMKSEHQLPSWRAVEKHGFTSSLCLEGYESANKWLKCALNSGLVVTQFKMSPVLNETEALQYF